MVTACGTLVILFLALYTKSASACNGYSLKVNHYKNCLDDNIVKIENGAAKLDKDCNLILTGCLIYPKGFKTAKGTYSLKKAPMPPLEGELDFCEAADSVDNSKVEAYAKMYNLPKTCPWKPGKTCGSEDKKIDLSKFKNQLGLAAGTADVRLDIDHDNGKTCLELNVSITKAKKGRSG